MRNDARPIGTEAGRQSPVRGHESPVEERQSSLPRRRSSELVNRAEHDRMHDGDNADPAMPSDEATLNTKI